MQNGGIYVSELSVSRHNFIGYHFCRGNSNRRKTRIGVIAKGSGKYTYMNKTLCAAEGDVVFIPENIYCYSEWRGEPDIAVVYVSCFMHYDGYLYEPQIISCGDAVKEELYRIAELLSEGAMCELEAYSVFYRVLQKILPHMRHSDFSADRTLCAAIEYIADHWAQEFSIGDVAKKCCVSESTLYHLFQKELGQTPIAFLNSIKVNHAIEYLENTQYSIATISRLAGFRSENHFRKTFSGITGTTPLKYRKKA